LLGPSSRVWTEDEINDWLASLPVEQSRQTKERAAKSVKARQKTKQEKLAALPSARQVLEAEYEDAKKFDGDAAA
jgi:hypothetical protein